MNPAAVVLSDHLVQELKVNPDAKLKTSENNVSRGLNFISLPMSGVSMFPLPPPSGNSLPRSSLSSSLPNQAILTSQCISSSSNFMKGPFPFPLISLPPKCQLPSVAAKAITSKGILNSSSSIKSNVPDPQQQLFLCLLQQQQVSALKVNNQSKFIISQSQAHHLKLPIRPNSSTTPIVLTCATTSAPLATSIKLLPNQKDTVLKRDKLQNVFQHPISNVGHSSEALDSYTGRKPHLLVRKAHSHTDITLEHLNDSISNKSFQRLRHPSKIKVTNGLKMQPDADDRTDVVLLEELIQKKKLSKLSASKADQPIVSGRSILKMQGLSHSRPKSLLMGLENSKSYLKSFKKIHIPSAEFTVSGVNNFKYKIPDGQCGSTLKRQSSFINHNISEKSICSRKKKMCLNNIKLEVISNSAMRNLTTPSSFPSCAGSSSDESDCTVPCLDRLSPFVDPSFSIECNPCYSPAELPVLASMSTRQDRIRYLLAKQRQRFLSMRRRLLSNESLRRHRYDDVKSDSSYHEEAQMERSQKFNYRCQLAEVVENVNERQRKKKSPQAIVNSELRSCRHRDNADKSCSQPALPYSNHCCRHIMYSVDQQLFSYCTAKSADNMQCCVPVLNTRYSIPLCSEHRNWSPKNEQCSDILEASKKAKKKSKSASLLRPPKKGKKKAKATPADAGNSYGSALTLVVKGDGNVAREFVSVADNIEEPPNPNVIQQAISGIFNENPTNNSYESDTPSFDFRRAGDVISKDGALDDDVMSSDLLKDLDLQIDPSYCFIDTHEIHDVFGKLPIEVFDFIPSSLRLYILLMKRLISIYLILCIVVIMTYLF